MPVFIRYSGYKVFFWVHENGEPIHFHVALGQPTENATKIWILSDGSFEIAHNKSEIPAIILRRILRIMQDELEDYKRQWQIIHGIIRYYK